MLLFYGSGAVFLWQRTLEIWNNTATSRVVLLFHTTLLDSLGDAFLSCVVPLGQSAPQDSGIIPMMEMVRL